MRKERSDKGTRRRSTQEDVSITIRLSPGNTRDYPDDARVLAIAQRWLDEDSSRTWRQLVTMSILKSAGDLPDVNYSASLADLSDQFAEQLDRLQDTIERLISEGVKPAGKKPAGKSNVNLGYLQNLKQALKGSDDD